MTIKCWAVVPATGVGKRMGRAIPKQYLPLKGGLVIHHTLRVLLDHPQIVGVVAGVSAADQQWQAEADAIGNPRLVTVVGGVERCHTVRNALAHLETLGAEGDWALVHDAARPCLRAADITRLIARVEAGNEIDGAILGVPVRDTMKQVDANGYISHTVPRDALWHALTPQLYPVRRLREAIDSALEQHHVVTDEASAMEICGANTHIVEGHSDNLKITHPADLALAELILEAQSRSL